MPVRFDLVITSLTLPTLPPIPDHIDPATVKSSHIPNHLGPSSPLSFELSLPNARPKDALYPATHLMLSYNFKGTGEVHVSRQFTSQDLVLVQPGSDEDGEQVEPVYEMTVKPEHICRVKVNHGESPDGELRVRAWKREKLLGVWTVGEIEGLGIEGLKSEPEHLRLVEQWKKTAASRA